MAELDPRSVAAERRHQDRHKEWNETCSWNIEDSLNSGCMIRYVRYREEHGLEPGHDFDKAPVPVIHPNDLSPS